jgi:hypothetical protein
MCHVVYGWCVWCGVHVMLCMAGVFGVVCMSCCVWLVWFGGVKIDFLLFVNHIKANTKANIKAKWNKKYNQQLAIQ